MIEFGGCNMAYEFSLLSALIHPERVKMSSSHAVVRTAGIKEKRKEKIQKCWTLLAHLPHPLRSRCPHCAAGVLSIVSSTERL